MEISKPSDDVRSQVVTLVCGSVLVLIFGLIGVGGYAFYHGVACLSELRWIPANSVCGFQSEIVFARAHSTPAGPSGPSRICAVDPNTGLSRDLDIVLSGLVLSSVTDGNRLWIISPDEIVEFDGTSSSRFSFDRLVNPLAIPFLLDGFLTTILKDDKGSDYLYRFEEGEWKKGRQIALPGTGRKWTNNGRSNRSSLIPRTSHGSVSATGGWETIGVVQIGNDVHLFAKTFGAGPPTVAYRLGWDEIDQNTASALVPANDLPDTGGWLPLDTRYFNWQSFPCSYRNEFLIATTGEGRLWAPIDNHPGKFQQKYTRPPAYLGQSMISYIGIATSNDELFSVEISAFQSMKLFRLTDGRFDPLPFTVPGNAEKIIGIKRRTVRLGLVVVVLANLVLLVGAVRIAAHRGQRTYSFGHQVIDLAPLSRRWIARSIDLLVMLLPWIAVRTYVLSALDSEERFISQFSLIVQFQIRQAWRIWEFFFLELFPLLEHDKVTTFFCYLATVLWGLLFAAVSTAMQGRTGVTPGKWCCGIRVVRSTLRPCGEARSLLRELLFPIDSLCLLPIPGAASILLSDGGQRWGDVVADTIVIVDRVKRDGLISGSLDLETSRHGHASTAAKCTSG